MKAIKLFLIALLLQFTFESCKLFDGGKGGDPVPSPQGIAIKVTDGKKAIEGAEVSITSANKNDSKPTGSDGSCNFEGLLEGKYIVSVSAEGYKPQSKYPEVSVGGMSPVLFQLELLPMLEVNPAIVNFNNNKKTETVYFKNRSSQGDINLNFEGFEKWLSVDQTNLTIPSKQQKAVTFTADAKGIGFGSHSSKVILNYKLNGNNDNTDMTVYLLLANPQAPSVETNNPTGITQTSADITGIITNTGGSPVIQRGITWSKGTDPKPENDAKEIISGGGLGSFTLTAKNLKEGEIYYARSYAINSSGTAYGNVVQFTTATTPTPPSVTLEPIKNITLNSAALFGKLSNNGGSNVIDQGFCWNTTGNPKTTDNKIQANTDANGNFSANMMGLSQGVVYYVRAYAINGLGTNNAGYSQVEVFKTQVPITPAKFTTLAATNITENSAKLFGNLMELGSSPIVQYGFCWSTTNIEPTINDKNKKVEKGALVNTGKFEHILTGLTKGTNYYVRAFITTQDGKTYYGDTVELFTNESGLVLYYPFNESTVDESRNGNNATSQAKFTNDRYGNSRQAIDLATGFIQITNRDMGGYCGDFTISFWINMRASNFIGDPKCLISRLYGCMGNGSDGFSIYTNSDSKRLSLFINPKSTPNDFPLMREAQLVDTWHHFTFTKSGKQLKFFLDGQPFSSHVSDYDCALGGGNIAFGAYTDAKSRIGSFYNCNNNQSNFNGLMDDFRIYNFPLTDNDVEELYKR